MSRFESSGHAIRGALVASAVLGAVACAGGDLVEGLGESGGSAGVGAGATSGIGGSAGHAGSVAGTGTAAGGASSGGSVSAGGTTASGGSMSSGGSVSSGGTSAGTTSASGGSMSSGGSTSTGGTGSNNCTDTPPPNGDTCENAVAFGWCGQDWLNGACAQSCDMCEGGGTGGSSSTGGASSTGGTSSSGGTFGGGGGQPPRIDGGTPAWASRYWDCCKPACGWQGNVQSGSPMKSCGSENQVLGSADERNACEAGGTAYMCWSGVPWAVSDTLAYGYAAASGSNYRCGACYQLQFTGSGHHGNNAGAQALNGKTMIVQVINNGGVASDQFDILIPGGGVGDFDACTSQWGVSDLGERYGGFLGGCGGDAGCVRNKCNEVFAGKPDLMRGCDWFLDWYEAADNPNLVYQPIDCPAALMQASGLQDPG